METKTVKAVLKKHTVNFYKYELKENEIMINLYLAKTLITTEKVPMTLTITIQE